MQAISAVTVDEAIAGLFPEDHMVFAPFTKISLVQDNIQQLSALPSDTYDVYSVGQDTQSFEEAWNLQGSLNMNSMQNTSRSDPEDDQVIVHNFHFGEEEAARQEPAVVSSDSESEVAVESPRSNGFLPTREKKRLIAWTREEHERFVFALERLRTEHTEGYDKHGKKTKGLGPGIAEVIAVAVGTRNAAQVRSHAQKYFGKQRRQMGM